MARIRTIKPDFFRHEELQDLSKKHGLEIMLVFIGIWTQCDKEGNFLFNHRQLSLDILPFLKIDMEKVLDVLGRHKYVLRYTKDGKDYGHIPTFKKHQMIFGSERKYTAKYPEFTGISEDVLGQSLGIPRTLDYGLMDNGIKEEVPEVSGPVNPLKIISKKKEFEESSNEMKAAKYFWAHVKEWSPSAKEPSPASFQKWAKDFDLIMRIDKRTKDEIKEILAWIDDKKESATGFSWRKVVLSPATLRARWNEGKFADFVKVKPGKERSIYDIIPNLRIPNENGEYV
jgi:hypothetical protein